MARTRVIPEQWKVTKIIPLYKGKGSRALVENYRPIAIVDITYKIFTYVLYFQIRPKLESQLLDEQRGFCQGKSTSDAIATVQRVEEECRKAGINMVAVFVDIAKAYDSVPRNLLFGVLKTYGLEPEMVEVLQLLYTDTMGRVVVNGVESELFDITSGVKQGCILSPILFNVYVDFALRQCLEQLRENGIPWEYPEDALRALSMTDKEMKQLSQRSAPKWYKKKLGVVQFADDKALLAPADERAHKSLVTFTATMKSWCLRVSVAKTKYMIFGPKTGPALDLNLDLDIDGQPLEQVSEFKYLGSIITDSGDQLANLKNRVRLGNWRMATFDPLWRRKDISPFVKGKFMRNGVLGPVFHGIERCSLTKKDLAWLDERYHRWMAWALNLPKQWLGRRLSNVEMRKRLRLQPLVPYIQKRILQWAGHNARAHDRRPTLPSIALSGRLDTDVYKYPEYGRFAPPGPRMWKPALKQALIATMRGTPLFTDEMARNKAGWEKRTKVPLIEATKDEVACPHCQLHYQRQELERHMTRRHGGGV